MTLAEAKEQSLKRWRKILEDYPNIKMGFFKQPDNCTYGRCGFCKHFDMLVQDCETTCLLYPNICTPEETSSNKSLYWQICEKLEAKKPCKDLIEQMIKAIEEIK